MESAQHAASIEKALCQAHAFVAVLAVELAVAIAAGIFAEGVEFFWQVGREKLEFKRQVRPSLYPQDGYHLKYNPKFRPLLKPPAPGQS